MPKLEAVWKSICIFLQIVVHQNVGEGLVTEIQYQPRSLRTLLSMDEPVDHRDLGWIAGIREDGVNILPVWCQAGPSSNEIDLFTVSPEYIKSLKG
jgi:hypothetical protein